MTVHTHDYISELYSGLIGDLWDKTWKNWDITEKFLDLTFPIEMVNTHVTKIVPPISRSKVDNAVDQLITSDPAVTRKPLGSSEKAKGTADRIDTAGGLILKNLSHEATYPPFKAFARHMLAYGYGAGFGPRWKDELWPLLPERKTKARMAERDAQLKQLFPFDVIVPHPRKIILDPFEGKNPPYGFLVTSRTVDMLKREYPLSAADIQGKPFEMRQVVAYWSEDQHIVWVTESPSGETTEALTGTILLEKENPYSFTPFFQSFSGLGMDGNGTLSDNLARLCRGLLDGVQPSVVAYAEAVTAMGEMMKRFAYQHIFVPRGQEDEIAAAMAEGLIVGLDGQVTMEQLPTVPPWVMEFQKERLADIDSGTYGDVLRGVRPAGVTTASQHAQIVSKAKQVFHVPMQQVNHVAGIFLGNCFKLVETYKDPVTVEGYVGKKQRRVEETITGKDFEGNYQVEVDFAASDPMEQAAKTEQYAALWREKAIDWETFMRDGLHHPDLTEVEKRRWIEAVSQTPEVQQQVMAEVTRRWQAKIGTPTTPSMLGGGAPVAPGMGNGQGVGQPVPPMTPQGMM